MLGKVFLGKYRTIRFLGEGSNAHVYLAQSLADPNTLVVVKRIKDHVLATPRFRQFFDNEVRTMTRFVHPYSVRLFDASLDDPLGPCLVLDFIPGVTLESVLTKYRRLPAERVARLIGPLCHALDAAHKAGIVHRDLKPANLMVLNVDTPQETVRVMDFGFAGFSTKPHIQLAELTGTGPLFACGTPAYVSPANHLGADVSRGADHHPRLGERVGTRDADRLGDAEVHHHGLAFVQHDVLGLYVAVHDALPIRVVERRCDRAAVVHGFLDGKLLLAIESFAQ